MLVETLADLCRSEGVNLHKAQAVMEATEALPGPAAGPAAGPLGSSRSPVAGTPALCGECAVAKTADAGATAAAAGNDGQLPGFSAAALMTVTVEFDRHLLSPKNGFITVMKALRAGALLGARPELS
jgi:hypothetical protein